MKRINVMGIGILMCICMMFLSGCYMYNQIFDDCIERNPTDGVYCECIARLNDGNWAYSDDHTDTCFQYKVENKTQNGETQIFQS